MIRYSPDYTVPCVHSFHKYSPSRCSPKKEMEHAYGRVGHLQSLVVPCCRTHNSKIENEHVKKWNQFCFIILHGLPYLQRFRPQKKWKPEFTSLFNYFREMYGDDKLLKKINQIRSFYLSQ